VFQTIAGWGIAEWVIAATLVGGIITVLTYLEFTPKNLLALIRQRRAKRRARTEIPPKPAAPDPPGPWIGFPQGDPVIGREWELKELRETLGTRDGVAIANSNAILPGQGGIGKTTLARAYAERNRRRYHGGLWMLSSGRQNVIAGWCGLAPSLGLKLSKPYDEGDAKAVIAAMQATAKLWLVVFDNVVDRADLSGLIPDGIHSIVTTRQGEGWPGFAKIEAGVLPTATPTDAGVKLLMRAADRTDRAEDAQALAATLGGLPLALVVAGALIRRTGEGFATYAARLDEVLRHTPENAGYPTSVMGAVELSYRALARDAQALVDVLAWWAPEGLETGLFTDAPAGEWWDAVKDDVPDDLQALAADPGRVRAAVLDLQARSLVTRGTDTGGWALHRMTAAALRALQADRADDAPKRAAAALLAAVYPGGDRNPGDSPQWRDCARLTPHVQALWSSGAAPATAAMGTLLNQSAIYLGAIGDHAGEIVCARASLTLKEARLPEQHRDIAAGHATLGMALARQGDLDAAETHLIQAVALHERHRPKTADLADSYDLLGGVLLRRARQGDPAALPQAADRRRQALALRCDLFGRRSDPVAGALNNLAAVRSAQGRRVIAAGLYARSLAIRRQVLPAGDARLGYGLMNLGAARLRLGRANAAEPLLRQALALWETVHADRPHHEDRRIAADWLVSCLLVLARVERAKAQIQARRAEAQAICDAYGFDFTKEIAYAQQQFSDPVDTPTAPARPDHTRSD